MLLETRVRQYVVHTFAQTSVHGVHTFAQFVCSHRHHLVDVDGAHAARSNCPNSPTRALRRILKNCENKDLTNGGREQVLEGISRQVAIELCGKLGYSFEEADMDIFDAYVADGAASPPHGRDFGVHAHVLHKTPQNTYNTRTSSAKQCKTPTKHAQREQNSAAVTDSWCAARLPRTAEAFITSTSWAICGLRTINGRAIGGSTMDKPHGPVTQVTKALTIPVASHICSRTLVSTTCQQSAIVSLLLPH